MATWVEIGVENYRAARDLFENRQYRSSVSRFYYAVFSVLTHELTRCKVVFAGGRETPSHAQLPSLMETHLTHLGPERLGHLVGYIVRLYRDRLAGDYSQQRVDRQFATSTYRAAEKVFRYLEVKHE